MPTSKMQQRAQNKWLAKARKEPMSGLLARAIHDKNAPTASQGNSEGE